MNILITGGAGFIGSRLRKALENKGYMVYILTREPSKSQFHITADVRDKNLDLSKFEVVYHLAAIANPRICEQEKELAWSINVEGTMNIAEKVMEDAKLVFMSSAKVYDKSNKMHKENETPKPQNFYGLTKLIGEEIVKYFGVKRGYQATIFRLFNAYSADQPEGFLVPDVIQKYKKKKEVDIINPYSFIDLVHVDDVVNVLSSVVERRMIGTYNICTGKPTQISEVYSKIKKFCNANNAKETKINEENPIVFYGDNSKLVKMGFKFREFSLP
ncbi:MAG: NAD(P)-dependent oxidoreductase [Candidatus Anstonellales archaeon]